MRGKERPERCLDGRFGCVHAWVLVLVRVGGVGWDRVGWGAAGLSARAVHGEKKTVDRGVGG
jgi:hypothetical protein